MSNGTVTITRTTTFEVLACVNCGVEVGAPDGFYDRRRKDGQSFYCLNGHSMSWTPGKSDAQKAREAELARNEALGRARELQRALEATQDALNAEKRAHKASKARHEAALCPHCNRTFRALARHIASQHKGAEAAAAVADEANPGRIKRRA